MRAVPARTSVRHVDGATCHGRSRRVPPRAASRRGFTLIELLVVLAILVSLAALVLYGGQRVLEANKASRARTQLELVADAVRRYSDAWPAWKSFQNNLNAQRTITTKGFPDWCAIRLFDPAVFTTRPSEPAWNGTPQTYAYDIEVAAECLVYSLIHPENGGPFLKETDLSGAGVHETETDVYPSFGMDSIRRRDLLDPWGELVRYFWVYRSTNPANPTGYLPVVTPYYTTQPPPLDESLVPPKATAVVLESAGPDRKFGDQWSDAPTAQERAEAADNIWVMP